MWNLIRIIKEIQRTSREVFASWLWMNQHVKILHCAPRFWLNSYITFFCQPEIRSFGEHFFGKWPLNVRWLEDALLHPTDHDLSVSILSPTIVHQHPPPKPNSASTCHQGGFTLLGSCMINFHTFDRICFCSATNGQALAGDFYKQIWVSDVFV